MKDWLVSRSYQPGTNDLFANALCDIFSFYLHKRQHWLPSSSILLIYLGGDFQFLRRRCSKINYMLIYGVVLLWFASRSIMVCYKDTKQTTAENTSTSTFIRKPETATAVWRAPDDGHSNARNMLSSACTTKEILRLIVASSWMFYLSDWRCTEPQTLNYKLCNNLVNLLRYTGWTISFFSEFVMAFCFISYNIFFLFQISLTFPKKTQW